MKRCSSGQIRSKSIYTVYNDLGVSLALPASLLLPDLCFPSPLHTTAITQSMPCPIRRHPHLSTSSASSACPPSFIDSERIYKYTLTCRDGAGRGK
jgi:hypothetical protein